MVMTLEKIDPAEAREFFKAKVSFTTGPVEVNRMIQEQNKDVQIIDVRAAEDYQKGHVPSAINLPKTNWDATRGLNKEKTNVLYCYSQACHLAAQAAVQFADKGFPVMEMEGGFKTWQESNLPIEH